MNILEPEQFNSADFSIKLLNKEGKIKLKLVNKTGQLVFAKTPFLIAPFSPCLDSTLSECISLI